MCCAQLARNKRLDSFFVRDLNAEPDSWALPERSFDAVLCCVSVQYLQQVCWPPLGLANQGALNKTDVLRAPSDGLVQEL